MSYFVKPGREFAMAAKAGKECQSEIVLGDQCIVETIASIRKNTPFGVVLALNAFLCIFYVLPMLQSQYLATANLLFGNVSLEKQAFHLFIGLFCYGMIVKIDCDFLKIFFCYLTLLF